MHPSLNNPKSTRNFQHQKPGIIWGSSGEGFLALWKLKPGVVEFFSDSNINVKYDKFAEFWVLNGIFQEKVVGYWPSWENFQEKALEFRPSQRIFKWKPSEFVIWSPCEKALLFWAPERISKKSSQILTHWKNLQEKALGFWPPEAISNRKPPHFDPLREFPRESPRI